MKYLISTICFAIIACGSPELIKPASVKNNVKKEKIDSISAKLLFYGDFWKNTLDTCFLITSQESLMKYTQKNTDIDFNKNAVLLILKPFSSTHHQISFKDFDVKKDTLIISYIYKLTNKEVEGPPKKIGLLIPKTKVPVKVIEHYISDKFEGVRTKEMILKR